MVRPALRSRSKRRVSKRTPGGKLKTYYVKFKSKNTAKCAICGKVIHGTNLHARAKTEKRPSRPYPNLCSRCARAQMKIAARNL